jgi:hypothetical protein
MDRLVIKSLLMQKDKFAFILLNSNNKLLQERLKKFEVTLTDQLLA